MSDFSHVVGGLLIAPLRIDTASVLPTTGGHDCVRNAAIDSLFLYVPSVPGGQSSEFALAELTNRVSLDREA